MKSGFWSMDFVGRGQNELLVCYLENSVACNECLQWFHSCLLLLFLRVFFIVIIFNWLWSIWWNKFVLNKQQTQSTNFNVELAFCLLLDKIILQSKLKMWRQILIAMQATEIFLSASIKAGVSFQYWSSPSNSRLSVFI